LDGYGGLMLAQVFLKFFSSGSEDELHDALEVIGRVESDRERSLGASAELNVNVCLQVTT
jgi:hypothetical protein